jgi:hypothetical protein
MAVASKFYVDHQAGANDFLPMTFYREGTLIVDSGILYRAIADFISGANFDPTDWEEIGSGGGTILAPTDNTGIVYVLSAKDEVIEWLEMDNTSALPVAGTVSTVIPTPPLDAVETYLLQCVNGALSWVKME